MILKPLLQTVYPDGITCIACGGELNISTRYGLCDKCRPPDAGRYCHICGTFVSGSKNYCDSCIYTNSKRAFDQARAPFCYDNEAVRKIVYGLKYGDKTYLAAYMAQFMADVYYRQGWQPDIMTYVPVHWRKKLFSRGYDQSELIARHLSAIINVPTAKLLVKTKYTRKNAAKLGKTARKRVLDNTFDICGDVRGKNILLIDDVFTTGATTDECAKVLKAGKAQNVWVLTFATSQEKTPLYSLDQGDELLNKFIIESKI